MTTAFRLSADNAMLFFELCAEVKANTLEQRIAILNEMAKLGKVNGITKTAKTKDEYIKHLSQHFSVLKVNQCKSQI